jgi:hypothetical protein
MQNEHLPITVGNRDMKSILKSLGLEVRDSITFQMKWNFYVRM